MSKLAGSLSDEVSQKELELFNKDYWVFYDRLHKGYTQKEFDEKIRRLISVDSEPSPTLKLLMMAKSKAH